MVSAARRPATRRDRRRTFWPTRRGGSLLILGLGFAIAAYPTGRVELVYLGSLLAALPLLALAYVVRRRTRMAVARRFSPIVATAGDAVTVSVEFRNLSRTPTPEAGWSDGLPWRPFSTLRARLGPLAPHGRRGDTVRVQYVLRPPRRGIFDIGGLIVDFADPFSLVRGEWMVGQRQKLVVMPRVAVLGDTGLWIAADEGSARAMQRRASSGDDELVTREYRNGDPLRRVHWRASARHGELMVRQEEQRSHAEARVLIDTHLAGYSDATRAGADTAESDAFEWGVAFTASLTMHLQRAGFSVRIVETAERQLASPEYREEFLESLAGADLMDDGQGDGAFSLQADPGRSLGSAFAVVADARPETVARLVEQRALFDLAMAFVVSPRHAAVTGPLSRAGWICLAVRPTDDPVALWQAASAAREAHYARA